MGSDERHQAADDGSSDTGWSGLCRIGGVATFVLMAYSLATMVQLLVLGGQPTTAATAFSLLQNSRVLGLLRLDLPTMLALPPLRANIDETVLLVVITEQGENRNQCEEQWISCGFSYGFARRGT